MGSNASTSIRVHLRSFAANHQNHLRLILVVVCAALMIGLWAAQVNPYLNAADDSGRYMVLGESLARTGDLRLINDVRHLRDTLYVPGFPAIIAFWLLVTGRDPGGVVLLVKFTQLLLLLGTLPLLYTLLERARLAFPYMAAALLTVSVCPALIAYANEVMSEIPLLFLLLASVVLVERDLRKEPSEDTVPVWKRILSLLCAVASFYVRAAGIVLLLTLAGWFWKRFGWKWGMTVLLVTMICVGGWTRRNQAIIAHDPPDTHDTYVKQFTLRDPDKPDAGRIQLNVIGLLSRVKRGFPVYIGMIPRAPLYTMAPPGTLWLALFYIVAVPMTLLILGGFVVAWRRGMLLCCVFAALFWLFTAMWPWHSARFLVPLIPFLFLFLFLGVEAVSGWLEKRTGRKIVAAAQGIGSALLLLYFARVFIVITPHEHAPTLSGYALGRTRDEAGFYAACAWLKGQEPETVVMGRPAYLLHLYSGHPTTQIEPSANPRVQEKAYMTKNHVRYLLKDTWYWSKTDRYIRPYLMEYGDLWTLAWEDPNGSGVQVWRRKQ